MSHRAKALNRRVFMRATAMHDDQRVLDYLEWAYERAYGPHGGRDAADQ